MAKGKHVVPHQGKWAVRTEGATKVGSVHATQREAIDSGRASARASGAELFIHGRNGRIRERDSYGRDPYPPEG